jgi:hypothetical protein
MSLTSLASLPRLQRLCKAMLLSTPVEDAPVAAAAVGEHRTMSGRGLAQSCTTRQLRGALQRSARWGAATYPPR